MAKLPSNRTQHLRSNGLHASNMLIGLAAFLAIAYQHHGSPEIARIAHEAAGISHRTGNAREQIQVMFRREIRQSA